MKRGDLCIKKFIKILLFIFVAILLCIILSFCVDFFQYKDSKKDNENIIKYAFKDDTISNTNNSAKQNSVTNNIKNTNNKIENSENTKILVSKNINWNYLRSVNKDIIGWIYVEGTNINYPILKDQNDFYLKHSFNKKYNKNGSIFTINQKPFECNETTIYGHNMKNGNMFSNLDKFSKKEYFESHSKIKIYTPNGNYKGKIFSFYSKNVEDEIHNTKKLNFNSKIEYYENQSMFKESTNDEISKIIKLVTCSYINAKERPTMQRYYLVASIYKIQE